MSSFSPLGFAPWPNAVADGIPTDRQLRNSASETAARNIAGNADVCSALPSFWSDQYDLGLQVVGAPSPAHDRVVRQLPAGEVEFYLEEGRLAAAAGLASGNTVARDIKLAEMLIVAGRSPDSPLLADPRIDLKQFLR